ncbi:MAG: hypothetical protein WBO95_16475 [Candidatus Dechloromonas phosphoritropha]
MKFLSTVADPSKIITPIDASIRFPEILTVCKDKYATDIARFKQLVASSTSSANLLEKIRSNTFTGDERMSLLKMFRRSVSPVLDTEMAKKITKVSTATLVESLGHTFKPIDKLKQQFASLTPDQESALAALIGEYDTRGQLGYLLTGTFFDWFEGHFANKFTIEGPRGAGRDIELSTIYPDFSGSYPCDFVIREATNRKICAVGFARYDSTRGGAQSDDRTGGNSDKVGKAMLIPLHTTSTPLRNMLTLQEMLGGCDGLGSGWTAAASTWAVAARKGALALIVFSIWREKVCLPHDFSQGKQKSGQAGDYKSSS